MCCAATRFIEIYLKNITLKHQVTEKLQKILANAGLGSRRQMEQWIMAGRVSVNGKIASIGDRASERDKIRVDGKLLQLTSKADIKHRYLLYHKPEGEICSRSDPEQRPTVFQQLPKIKQCRWILVGRLDINTRGLLIVTTDGDLAHRLMHPSINIEREYLVRILGDVSDAMIRQLKKGVMLEDGFAQFKAIKFVGGEGANRWYQVTLMEGRKREVRRLWETQGVKVSRLNRIRFGPIYLPRHLRRGEFIDLSIEQVQQLQSL